MMSSYKINYKQIRQEPEMDEMLTALEQGFQHFGIDFYLVGAVARDVWMNGINNIEPRRTTGDIDFAVLINDKGGYEKLRTHLIDEKDFHPSKENSFVLIWKGKKEVDLLPFGSIEDENRDVTITGTGYTSIHVPGFKEVYDGGLPEVDLEDSHHFKICTLPGIVMLKIIAWDDRPEMRRDDIVDIADILNNFFTMYDEEIWENHNDLFETENGSLPRIAARVMGREIRKIAVRDDKLFARIDQILQNNTGNLADSRIGVIMAGFNHNTVEDNVFLLRELRMGLSEAK